MIDSTIYAESLRGIIRLHRLLETHSIESSRQQFSFFFLPVSYEGVANRDVALCCQSNCAVDGPHQGHVDQWQHVGQYVLLDSHRVSGDEKWQNMKRKRR